ncbi:hypothetical protein PG_1167 [Porphyromonas gingivalis W83]|uniref:Uncharacterized protein n=1 Tax=Porphyromonas gingivalis (strain ATCC BAA-308 / W83) TaxID=242619 RepID=Q7MVA9_PORGI|nr:hypothetical protein PG_1167 [Porphyromonas gingivalis W83]EIW94775.1 hypothetical protein HMPREF1322_1928 [Porphyromonas gingivalis W50]
MKKLSFGSEKSRACHSGYFFRAKKVFNNEDEFGMILNKGVKRSGF